MRGRNDGLLVPIHHHAHLRHGGEAGGARVLLEAAVAPEEGARHGGGDDERIEQHTNDNRLVDKPAITDLAREIRQKLGAGVAGRLALAWCVQSRGRKRKLHRQPEAVLGGYLTWIKMRIESCSTLLPWFE